ncbi:MAG TPA: SIS domain-containing protein [Phycisphaerales bacterium]|nr:SIS domain-containing protein [Phycisphaerales bacterium]
MLYQKGGAVYAEIQDQPRAWKQLITESASHKEAFVTWLKGENFGQVLLLGSADCYGVALSAASILHLVSGLNTIARPSSEILYLRRPPYDSRIKTLVVVLSVDGEDPDTVWAVEKMRKLHPACKVLYIGCEEGKLAGMADHKLLALNTIEETPIRSRSVSCLLLYTMILTVWISGKDVFLNELVKCSEALDFQSIQDQLRSVSGVKPQPQHITYLGAGPYAGVALHGSLKMKHMAAIGTSYENSLEYRHGYHYALTNMTMTCSLVSDTFREAELNVAYGLGTTRAQRVAICEKLEQKEAIRVEHSVELKCGLSEISRVLLMYPVVQLMAFYVALAKGVNPDKPREGLSAINLENKPGV